MQTLLESILAFPTALFTMLLGVVLVYWLLVIIGALGIDMFDGDVDIASGAKAAGGALEGGVKAAGGMLEGGVKAAGGALEGGIKAAGGALEGGIKAAGGALEGGVKAAGGALEGGVKAAGGMLGGAKALGGLGEGADVGGADGHDADADSGLLSILGFTGIPITISGTFIIFNSWFLSLLANKPAGELLGSVLPGFVISGGVFLLSLVLGTLLAALAVRPLRPIFVINSAPGREALMGRVCTINSGSVTDKFGHAVFEDGGAGVILNIFCAKANQLKRGDQALILGYDPARDVYEVEPVDWLLPEELAQIQDPTKAAAVAARARERVR
jgi:hypothetical protein